ncbi:aminoacyl-tRNA hydrolase [bacterium]|nr:aminoacyl-tRNA hydrolase [candidate division CSSED10-310 bacterium]
MGYRIIVGLGNPGKLYESTRHNAGFILCDMFSQKHHADEWITRPDYTSCNIRVKGQSLVVMKPLSYMNRSGFPVARVLREKSICPEEMIVIHDDLDLDSGRVKIKIDGGTAGHLGLQSIIDCIDTDKFTRIRVGIGHPEDDVESRTYVLSKPVDAVDFLAGLQTAESALETILFEGAIAAMNRYNQRRIKPKDDETSESTETMKR